METLALSPKKLKMAIEPFLRALWKIDLCQISSLVKNRRNTMLNTFFRVFQPCFSEINMLKNIMDGSVAFVVDM